MRLHIWIQAIFGQGFDRDCKEIFIQVQIDQNIKHTGIVDHGCTIFRNQMKNSSLKIKKINYSLDIKNSIKL